MDLILTIIGGILLGAIGTGVWNYLLDPLFKRFGLFILKIATTKAKPSLDKIYSEISVKSYERGTLFLLKIITFISFASIGIIIGITIADYQIDRETKFYQQHLDKEDITTQELKSFKKQLDERHKGLQEMNKIFDIAMIFIAFVIFIFLQFNYAKIFFIDSARSHLERCHDICLPLFTDEEQKKMRAMMATINSREDFFALLKKFSDIAEREKLKLPDFIPI